MTGAELRAARKAAKLSQVALAERVGVSRDTVQYWEAKPHIGRRSAGERMAEALGLRINFPSNAHAGGWGDTGRREEPARMDAWVEAQMVLWREREAQRLADHRVICGAKKRKGAECRNKSEPGKRRCKLHGGKSTGARTPERKARIAEAQRLRWARARGIVLKGHASL